MSSEISSLVASIIENNFATLAILTAVGYDYILTLSDEIEYVWTKPWGWVSTLFVLIRYCGLCSVVIFSLGNALSIFGEWMLVIFVGSADLVMILRLCAMYNGSRIVLGVLLTLYVMEIVPLAVAGVVYTIRLAMVVDRVLNFSACVPNSPSPLLDEVRNSLQFALASVMSLLVAAKFIRHSIQMYSLTDRRPELSRYLKLFAREGMFYFLAISFFGLINTLYLVARISLTGWQTILIAISEYVPIFTLTPRFILSMRALYAHDLRGRDLDTQFGFVPAPGRTSVIIFARLTEVQMSEQDEAIQMDGRETWSAGTMVEQTPA